MIPSTSFLLVSLFFLQGLSVFSEEIILTKAHEVLALSEDRAAKGIPISIKGIVTMTHKDWEGQFFVQDETAGIFINHIGNSVPDTGDIVEVTGISHPGGFAPVVGDPVWKKIGTAPLPQAKQVAIERLMAGLEDSQRVEISGTVRTVSTEQNFLLFHLTSGGFRFKAIILKTDILDPESLIGARLLLRGTAAATYKTELRQVITVNLFVPSKNDIQVEKLDQRDPFRKKPIAINKLAQYRPGGEAGERVRVLGVVTHQRPGIDLFVTDNTGGLQITSSQDIALSPGEMIEAVGFLDSANYLPVLQDAVIRKIEGTIRPEKPLKVTIQNLRESYHHAEFISLQGVVIDRTVNRAGGVETNSPTERIALTINAEEFIFTAIGPIDKPQNKLTTLPLGSTVELSGVGILQVDDSGNMESLQLLLPSDNSVRVLKEPTWLTTKRLLIGLGVLTVILILAISWSFTVSKKNRALKTVLSDKEQTQRELQEAHDMLEERVEERTAQLKFEMDERQEAEVRFKATLAERTRLAQELHDTTEQSLTGIGLQLDTAAKLYQTNPQKAHQPLEIARTLMEQSHAELRQSIWDLRSRELEQFEFIDALEMSAHEIVQGTEIQIKFDSNGIARPLSEVVEENLLRICREAINNALQHANATRIDLHLEFSNTCVTLRISDDGCGFLTEGVPGDKEGHFGLIGMSERAKRLHGTINIVSSTDLGTRIEVKIPLTSSPA